MGNAMVYLDTILVPLSILLMAAYHAYLWHCFNHKPYQTTMGIDSLKRKLWFQCFTQGDDKKSMLAVQSLRNTQTATIFTASIAILVNMALAALTNNTYNASHLLLHHHASQSGKLYALRFASASLFFLTSFLCSSMGIGFLVDASFLLNIHNFEFSRPDYAQKITERGFVLATIGMRVLCMSFPLLIWMFGAVPLALASVALVWLLYELDFCAKSETQTAKSISI